MASGILFSEIFKRLHLPYVVALVAAGIVIGPLGLDVIEFTPPMLFLGSIVAVFLSIVTVLLAPFLIGSLTHDKNRIRKLEASKQKSNEE